MSDESKRKLESLLKEKFDNISALRDRLQVGDSFKNLVQMFIFSFHLGQEARGREGGLGGQKGQVKNL